MFYERNYSSAMAMYALFLSAGSQVGPVIAGYLVAARGWRWFFIVCLIVAAVNLVTTFFFLPETTYEPEFEEEQDGGEFPEKSDVAHSHIESLPPSQNQAQHFSYTDYWKGLFQVGISSEAKKKGVLRFLGYAAWLPIPMLLLPGVLLASMMYGVVLGA